MGNFASSTQVFLADHTAAQIRSRLVDWMNERLSGLGYVPADTLDDTVDRIVTIAQAGGEPWLTIQYEGDQTESVSAAISQDLSLITVSTELHDSDVLVLNLFKDGAKIDHYNS